MLVGEGCSMQSLSVTFSQELTFLRNSFNENTGKTLLEDIILFVQKETQFANNSTFIGFNHWLIWSKTESQFFMKQSRDKNGNS